MNAMMGLDARLKQARIGVVLDVTGDKPLAHRAAELARARVDLLVLDATGADRQEFLRGFGELRRAAGTRPITGVLAPADLGAATRADLVIGQVPLPHPHALRITMGLDPRPGGGDGLIIEPADISRAMAEQPVGEAASLPWFVATSATRVLELIAVGARRFWLHEARPDQVGSVREALSRAWRSEPGGIALGGWGFRRP